MRLNRHHFLDALEQIAEAHTLERAQHYVQRLEKTIAEIKTNGVNDINLNRWKEYGDIHTDSLWILDKRDRSGLHAAAYWGNFMPQIPRQMIRRYPKKGEWILDPFAGGGTTLIESRRSRRNGINTGPRSRKVPAGKPTPLPTPACGTCGMPTGPYGSRASTEGIFAKWRS